MSFFQNVKNFLHHLSHLNFSTTPKADDERLSSIHFKSLTKDQTNTRQLKFEPSTPEAHKSILQSIHFSEENIHAFLQKNLPRMQQELKQQQYTTIPIKPEVIHFMADHLSAIDFKNMDEQFDKEDPKDTSIIYANKIGEQFQEIGESIFGEKLKPGYKNSLAYRKNPSVENWHVDQKDNHVVFCLTLPKKKNVDSMPTTKILDISIESTEELKEFFDIKQLPVSKNTILKPKKNAPPIIEEKIKSLPFDQMLVFCGEMGSIHAKNDFLKSVSSLIHCSPIAQDRQILLMRYKISD